MIGGFPLEELRTIYRRNLFDECIPFWYEHGIDHDLGGFYSAVTRDGSLSNNGKRGWHQGRGIWIFAHYYNAWDRDPRYLEAAIQAREFMLRYGRDERGDWVAHLTREGHPTEGATSIYTDIYMVHGLAELFKADGDRTGIDVAEETAHRIFNRITDPTFQHSLSSYKRPHRVNAVWFFFLAALTDLLSVHPTDDLERFAQYCLDAMLTEHLDPATNLFIELLAPDTSRFNDTQGNEVMPGHSAQACKALMDEALRKQDRTLLLQAVDILKAHYEAGWDPELGGTFYLIDIRNGQPTDDNKNAWQQIEFMVGLLHAFEHTGADWASKYYGDVHRWAFEKHPDPEYGLWHQLADRQGRAPETNTTRDFYHHPRMLMWNLESIERQIKKDAPW